MITPLLLVHGGAGNIPDSRVDLCVQGVKYAAKQGYAALQASGSVLDAVQTAVNAMENDETFNAGRGSVLNIAGDVEMDAIIIDGTNLKAGAVAAIQNIANPVDVARLVMERTAHVLIVGEGARNFASSQGITIIPSEELITQKAIDALEEFKKHHDPTVPQLGITWTGGVGTVGAVAIDSNGHVACATSTGGTCGKMVGRVGDTPLPGCGGYADDNVGAVSTTGVGESIMRLCLASQIIKCMEQGKSAKEATSASVMAMTESVGGTAGAITVSKKGETGIFFSSKRMAWAYQQDNILHYGIEKGQHCEEDLNISSIKPH